MTDLQEDCKKLEGGDEMDRYRKGMYIVAEFMKVKEAKGPRATDTGGQGLWFVDVLGECCVVVCHGLQASLQLS